MIAIPAEMIEKNPTVSLSSGRATHFLIYDVGFGASQTLKNILKEKQNENQYADGKHAV